MDEKRGTRFFDIFAQKLNVDASLVAWTNFQMNDIKGLTYTINILEKMGYGILSQELKDQVSKNINADSIKRLIDEGTYDEVVLYATARARYESPVDAFVSILKIYQALERYWDSDNEVTEAETHTKVTGILVDLSLTCNNPNLYEIAILLTTYDSRSTANEFLEERGFSVDSIKGLIRGRFIMLPSAEPKSECSGDEPRVQRNYSSAEVKSLIAAVQKHGTRWKHIKQVEFSDSHRSYTQLKAKYSSLDSKAKEELKANASLEKLTSFQMSDSKGMRYALNLLEKLDFGALLQRLKNQIARNINASSFKRLIAERKYDEVVMYATALGTYIQPTDSYIAFLKIFQLLERYWDGEIDDTKSEALNEISKVLAELSITCDSPEFFEIALDLASSKSRVEANNYLSGVTFPLEVVKDLIFGPVAALFYTNSGTESSLKTNRKYTEDEIECLVSAVEKHGKRWKVIKASDFRDSMRLHTQLKDKYFDIVRRAKEANLKGALSKDSETGIEFEWYRRVLSIENVTIL